jgi:adenine phosphoribosyltransferase
LRPLNPSVIVGLDARGFIFAPALALRLNVRFIPVRKRGKLPGETVQAKYVKEYGEDVFEMQRGRMTSDDRVVVVDDLIATGGSAKATGEIIKKLGATLLEYMFIMELTFLNGWKHLDAPVWRLATENRGTKAGYTTE